MQPPKPFTSSIATILLLDSDPEMRETLRDGLASGNYLVITAGDLGEAVDRLEETRPDLLVTRPYINSMPGHAAAQYLRSKRPGLPVLLVAGFMDDDRDNLRNSVADYHTFPKPFHRIDLLAAVHDVLSVMRKH